MNCNFAEKVSMMIDGEIPESEVKAVRIHIAECDECRDIEKAFLFFREQLRESATNFAGERIKATAKRPRFWRKGISVPVPAFAGVLLVLVGLSIGLIVWRSGQTGKVVVDNPTKIFPATSEKTGELSISRFDKGGRAEIYVTERQEGR
jgi:anti-sigma factor RsiW